MRDYIDLIDLLKYLEKTYSMRAIPDVELTGRITALLPKPSNLLDNVKVDDDCIFVKMDVFSIKMSGIKNTLKSINYSEPDDTYMVNGSICLYIPKNKYKFPDFYQTKTSIMFGSSTYKINYIIGYTFEKNKTNNEWVLKPNELKPLDYSSWKKDTTKYEYIQKCITSSRVERTPIVTGLQEFYAILKQDIKPKEKIVEFPKDTERPTPKPTYIRPKAQLESRLDIKEYSQTAENLKGNLSVAKKSRTEYIVDLKNKYEMTDENTDYIIYLVNSLRQNLRTKPVPTAKTGRQLLKNYLLRFPRATFNYLGQTVAEYLINDFDEIAEFILHHSVVSASDDAWELCKNAFGNAERFYACMLGQITGVSVDELENIELICSTNSICFSKLVNENPYALQVIGNLKFNDIEHLAVCLGKHNSKELDNTRNIAMLNSYISDSDKDSSTLFRKMDLQNAEIGVIITKNKFEAMRSKGTYMTETVQEDVRYYLRHFEGNLGYDLSSFYVKKNGSAIRKISLGELNYAIRDYVNSGLGIEYNGYVTSTRLLEKELYIYDTMYKMGKTVIDYDRNEIDRLIAEYEEIVGFKLEQEQRNAVYLLLRASGVITGSAGSGKTTVSNCLVYCLENLEPSMELKFGAPTGKAAKRMQEVVKRTVKTYHSMFRLGQEKEGIFSQDETDSSSEDVAYFFDENAMVTIDTFYAMLKKIDTETSRIYLFGDYNQLPPIGKGLMFKNLLRFMPCVCLTVSKRAAEGSHITLNSNYINNNSDGTNWKYLESGDDFFLMTCSDESITTATALLVKHYLGKGTPEEEQRLCKPLHLDHLPKVDGLTPDDIQVVSPLSKVNYAWGSTRLNTMLQPLFNNNTGYRNTIINQKPKTDNYTRFLIGDRVIHSSKNMYSMQWYSSIDHGVCQKTYGYGICNGEVGKIVSYFHADSVEFSDEIGFEPEDFKYPDNMRDDSSYSGSDAWFVAVKYYDYLSDSNYYILYRTTENMINPSSQGKTLFGEDLDKLMLFYAGTTHKLQGSQAKLIISVLGDVNYKGFITRNMIYTTFTRGEKLVFGVGSVSNTAKSMLTKARQDVAGVNTLTIGEIL